MSETEITFLDTKVYKGVRFDKESILDMQTHYKPTETFKYTNFYSCHPPGVKKGFIKGEALRLLRTNSSQVTFENDQKEATDTGEKSDTDQDYDESDNESDVGNDYEDDEDSDKDDYDDNEGRKISDILCTTKSGKTCRTWKAIARYLYY